MNVTSLQGSTSCCDQREQRLIVGKLRVLEMVLVRLHTAWCVIREDPDSHFLKFNLGPLSWHVFFCVGYVCVCAVLNCFSCVRLSATPWTVAHQAPLPMGFSRPEYWRGMPCPSPGGSSWKSRKQACISKVSCTGERALYRWCCWGAMCVSLCVCVCAFICVLYMCVCMCI